MQDTLLQSFAAHVAEIHFTSLTAIKVSFVQPGEDTDCSIYHKTFHKAANRRFLLPYLASDLKQLKNE